MTEGLEACVVVIDIVATTVSTVRVKLGATAAAEQPLAKAHSEQAVGDGVEAGVEEAKDEEHMSKGVRDGLLHVIREQPVPQTQEVIRCPAHHEGADYDHTHLQSPHACSWDVVVRAAEVHIPRQHYTETRGSDIIVHFNTYKLREMFLFGSLKQRSSHRAPLVHLTVVNPSEAVT